MPEGTWPQHQEGPAWSHLTVSMTAAGSEQFWGGRGEDGTGWGRGGAGSCRVGGTSDGGIPL